MKSDSEHDGLDKQVIWSIMRPLGRDGFFGAYGFCLRVQAKEFESMEYEVRFDIVTLV